MFCGRGMGSDEWRRWSIHGSVKVSVRVGVENRQEWRGSEIAEYDGLVAQSM